MKEWWGEEPERFYILRYRLSGQPEFSNICINEYTLFLEIHNTAHTKFDISSMTIHGPELAQQFYEMQCMYKYKHVLT